LQSAINLAVDIKVPNENLIAQAPHPRTGLAGAGTSRPGANLKITALEWQEPLLNPVELADVSLGRSPSLHSDPAGRLYVPSGVNLLLSGLFAFAVVIGLLLAGSFRAVVGISLIFAGVAVVVIAL
jgi:hypothetical protein